MTAADDDWLAADYVLGVLDAEARGRLRLRMVEDKAFAARVAAWEQRLAPLALAGSIPPPANLLAKIEAEIVASGEALPGTLTQRAGRGEWTVVSPGLRIKVLNEIAALGRQTFLAWLAPGAEYAGHDHGQDEEIYMIEGDLSIGAIELKAGDFHVARAGKHHPMHRTRAGCLCLISQAAGPV